MVRRKSVVKWHGGGGVDGGEWCGMGKGIVSLWLVLYVLVLVKLVK